MNKFFSDEASLVRNIPFRKEQFFNVRKVIDTIFSKRPIIIFTQTDTYSRITTDVTMSKMVKLKGEFLENNLRLAESYLPEYLFAIASTDAPTISRSIEILSRAMFPTNDIAYNVIFLTARIRYFFAALFFGDILDKAWNGELKRRSIVLKDEMLNFYDMENFSELVTKLLTMTVLYAAFDSQSSSNEFYHLKLSIIS